MKLFAPARPLLIAAALGFGGGHARPAEPASPEPVTLQLKWHHQFQFADYYAAQAQGFYAAEGLALTVHDGQLRVEIRDNGRGITPAQLADPTAYGLLGMRERVAALDGEITINGAAGRGTTVVVTLPVAASRGTP